MIREYVEDGVAIKLDLGPQVLSLDAPATSAPANPPLSAAPSTASPFLSASVLAHKAKQVDDAMYAAAEVAMQRGFGDFAAKASFLESWAAAAVARAEDSEATGVLLAACELGGAKVSAPPALGARARALIEAFLADEGSSKPLGFYSQSQQLASIFQQDRMLMKALQPGPATTAMAELLRADPDMLRGYQRLLAAAAKLTNPPNQRAQDVLGTRAIATHLLPPSRSLEEELMLRLFGDGPIPEGFTLIEAVAQRVEAGELSFRPAEDSGWYEHQCWALEPLVAPERTEEHAKLRLSAEYRGHLRDLFKGMLALARETHAKQLPMFLAGGVPTAPPKRIVIRPKLSAEPLVTHYARRAQSYRFLAGALQALFGPKWREIPCKELPISYGTVGEAVEAMEAILHGASVRVRRELGLKDDLTVLPDRAIDADDAAFSAWLADLSHDRDLRQDSRMMIPIFFDQARRKTKVLAVLGWATRFVNIDFATPPPIMEDHRSAPAGVLNKMKAVFSGAGLSQRTAVVFEEDCQRISFPVTAELYVDSVFDREAFRSVCDRYRTCSDILAALTAK